MTTWGESEQKAAQRLVDLALAEDLDTAGDVTSAATIPTDAMGAARFVARRPGTIAGLPAAMLVCSTVDSALRFESVVQDGDSVASGATLAHVSGRMRSILVAERTALNFLQRLSGIATLTRRYVDIVAGRSRVLDTRKTTPGWRILEKYAVRMGGGCNHRVGLFDAILIKDNHLAALGGGPAAIRSTIVAARRHAPALRVEIEVDSEAMFDSALAANPDVVLLDNMSPELMHRCVEIRNARAPDVKLEASGGVSLDTIDAIAATGVDRISVGALTHSAPALDIALDYESWPTRR